jgi:hypothetical protein
VLDTGRLEGVALGDDFVLAAAGEVHSQVYTEKVNVSSGR